MSGQGLGLAGIKMGIETSKTSNNGKPLRKPKKRVPLKKRFARRKQRGKHLKKNTDPVHDLPDIGSRTVESAEIISSDEEVWAEFLKELCVESKAASVTSLSTSDIESGDNTVEELPPSSITDISISPQPVNSHSVSSGYKRPLSATSADTEAYASSVSKQDVLTADMNSESSSVIPVVALSVPNMTNECNLEYQEDAGFPTSYDCAVSEPSESTFSSLPMVSSPTISESGYCPAPVLIKKVVEKLSATLPPFWVSMCDKKGLQLYRYSINIPKRAIQREIFVPFGSDEQIFVHCMPLPFAKNLLQSIKVPKVALCDDTVETFCMRAVCIAKTLEQYTVCMGANVMELQDVWENIANSHVDKNPYQELTYSSTCRSNSCDRLIILGRGKRCQHCSKVIRSLRQARPLLLSHNPHPHTPNIRLTHKQALEKLQKQHEELRKKDSKIAYLKPRALSLSRETTQRDC